LVIGVVSFVPVRGRRSASPSEDPSGRVELTTVEFSSVIGSSVVELTTGTSTIVEFIDVELEVKSATVVMTESCSLAAGVCGARTKTNLLCAADLRPRGRAAPWTGKERAKPMVDRMEARCISKTTGVQGGGG
jgi:hypothetical protein